MVDNDSQIYLFHLSYYSCSNKISYQSYQIILHADTGTMRASPLLMSIVLSVHPGVQLDTQVDSKKKFLQFSHGRDLAAFNGTGL